MVKSSSWQTVTVTNVFFHFYPILLRCFDAIAYRSRRALLAVLGALCIEAVYAETPEQWLMQMSANSARLSYSGSLVYAEGKRMQAMKIYHALKNGQRRERLVHLSGEPREFIRRGETVMCVDTVNGVVKLGRQGSGLKDTAMQGDSAGHYPGDYAARFASLREPYRVSFAGRGRVAGREVALIALQPKDNYRYGFSLALDTESKLLLRSLMLNAEGAVLERFEYTEITIGQEISNHDLEPQLKVEPAAVPATSPRYSDASATKPRAQAAAWRVNWVPPAFTRSAKGVAGQGAGNAGESRQMYSDGLTAFSVFVEDNTNLGRRSWQRGATTAHTVVKQDDAGVFSVTVVGELPLVAARKIAASVSRGTAG